jgi:hypothetical protein
MVESIICLKSELQLVILAEKNTNKARHFTRMC